MRRRSGLAPSQGTQWPSAVRAHVRTHQWGCLGAYAGMPGPCIGELELDHVRASGGVGMKSDSIAVNGARLCNPHHDLKTLNGRIWRPVLIDAINALAYGCESCEGEYLARYGMPMPNPHDGHVDPCPSCPPRKERTA